MASPDEAMVRDCRYDSSNFVTSLVLYSLRKAVVDSTDEMIARAIGFLRAQANNLDLWRYWTRDHELYKAVPPDLDDTCNISYVLKLYAKKQFRNNDHIVLNTDADGRFFTWIAPRKVLSPKAKAAISADISPESILALMASGVLNDIDPVVNASVVLYLGECDQTKRAIDFIIDLIERRIEVGSSRSYPDALALYYFVSRAYAGGITSFGRLGDTIIKRTREMQHEAGDYGSALRTAIAMCTLQNFCFKGDLAGRFSSRLLEMQRADGSWPRAPLYVGPAPYYGSEELTTALCLEALLSIERA